MGLKSVNEYSAPGTIFYFDRDMTMINYATGTAIKDTRHIASVGEAGNPWAFFPSTSHEGKFKVINVSNQYYLHDNEGNRADRCDRDAADHANTHSWTIEPVTTLPVTITAAKYATFFAPVAVTVPAGVTAHTVTINGDWATLSEALEVIPANTGVVLYSETADTYNFTITENVEAIEGNALRGSAAATYYTTAGTYYALGLVDGEVGFYKDAFNNSRFQNNSHKAYLYVEGTQNAASYSFRFGEGTTGVENVEVENQVKTIFDLTGRKVEAITAPGIYIVNGKKVLVK